MTEATPNHTPEPRLRAILAALAKTEAEHKNFPEPRIGAEFDAKTKAWQRAYDRAVKAGAQIEAEDE